MAWYTVIGKDEDGCELVAREAIGQKAAKDEMKLIATDKEYIASGLHKVEVIGKGGVVVADMFVRRTPAQAGFTSATTSSY